MNTSLIPNFTGKRWLKISLRTLHLIGMAGVFTSVITATPMTVYWFIALCSGVGLLILEAFSNILWFVQVRGLVMYIKLALFVGVFYLPEFSWYFLTLMIGLSGIISHAPGSVRYFSFIHFKIIKSVEDIKG